MAYIFRIKGKVMFSNTVSFLNALAGSLFFFCLLACQADPSPKKVPLLKRQVINKSVNDNYKPFLDILFIIDDSGSMDSVKNLLAQNADQFVNEFLKTDFIDYHIAVSPAGEKGRENKAVFIPCKNVADENKNYNYKNYVDKKTPKSVECLREMLITDVGRSLATETFLEVIVDTFENLKSKPRFNSRRKKRRTKGEPFYRPSAHLAIIVITDTDEQSDTSPDFAYDYLVDLKYGEENKLHYIAGVVTFPQSQNDCEAESDAVPGGALPGKLLEMKDYFGPRGYVFNLCQFDYGEKLAQIANRLIDSVLTVPLDQTPDIDSIEVSYKFPNGRKQMVPNDSVTGWTYDSEINAIRLSRKIQLNSYGDDSSEDGEFNIQYKNYYELE